jgi:SagB-type dehydrogenase family enzyme
MMTADKRYPSARVVPLPPDGPAPPVLLAEALRVRRSFKGFDGTPVGFGDVARLLRAGAGVTATTETPAGVRVRFRAAPSGGALYPVEAYLFAGEVTGLPAGLYHYRPAADGLELLRPGGQTAAVADTTFSPELARAAAVVALTGIPLKTRLKYGERGYRFMLLEAGHIAQNILLTAAALRLGALPVGGFVDDELNQLLGIDGVDEISLYLIAVGGGCDSCPV